VTDSGRDMDSGAVASVLADYCADTSFDVILCGKQSQDMDAGLTGGMLAAHLDLPYATNAVGLDIHGNEAALVVKRQGDSGQEILHLPFPCLVTCSNDMNNPRIPSLKGIMQAKKKSIDVRPLENAPASATTVVEYSQPGSREPAKMLDGEPVDKVQALVTALVEDSGLF
jgi:electron transfer flavoprotein beta subunit